MKITFGTVAYHEEKMISRCLASVKEVADEIIVVHDGPCEDRTLELAATFGAKCIVGPRYGGSDPHRLAILEEAKNDWVFMIDADEFLSPELIAFLKTCNEKVLSNYGAVAFKWPLWNGKKAITSHNYRPCFFNRKKCWAIGLHNFSIQSIGPIANFPYVLAHEPKESKLGLPALPRLKKRVTRDAVQYALGYEGLKKYNEKIIPETFKHWLSAYLSYPLLYAVINFFKHFIGSYRHVYLDGLAGFLVSLQLGLYQFFLGITLWKITRKSK